MVVTVPGVPAAWPVEGMYVWVVVAVDEVDEGAVTAPAFGSSQAGIWLLDAADDAEVAAGAEVAAEEAVVLGGTTVPCTVCTDVCPVVCPADVAGVVTAPASGLSHAGICSVPIQAAPAAGPMSMLPANAAAQICLFIYPPAFWKSKSMKPTDSSVGNLILLYANARFAVNS